MESALSRIIESRWAERSVWGVLGLTFLTYFIMKPDQFDRLVAIVLKAVAKVFAFCSKAAAKATVESEISQFLRLRTRQLEDPSVRVKVSWVEDAQDSRLQSDGGLIVRIRRDADNPRNTLAAFRLALPHVYVPRLRGVMPPPLLTALDLLILSLLSERLGNRTPAIFRSEYLDPELQADVEVGAAYKRLLDVRNGGLFEEVLLTEFGELSQRLPPVGVPSGLPQELREFADWVWRRATVQEGDTATPMLFVREHIKVAFILTSREATKVLGTTPYERRLGRHLAAGVRTIYLMPILPDQIAFTREISVAFDGDRRVTGGFINEVSVHRGGRVLRIPLYRFHASQTEVVDGDLLRSRHGFDCGLGERIALAVHTCDERSLRAESEFGPTRVPRGELGWGYLGTPATFRDLIQPSEGVVTGLDGMIDCSVRQLTEPPWAELDELVGRAIACEVVEIARDGNVHMRLTGLPSGRTDIFGLIEPSDWQVSEVASSCEIGQIVEAILLDVEGGANKVRLSRALTELDDWDVIKQAYPVGAHALATVFKVEGSGLWCTLPPGNVIGHIEVAQLRKAGHELGDFLKTVKVGSSYSVAVRRHREAKRRLTLDLARNLQ